MPIKPKLKSEFDVSNFDEEFTEEGMIVASLWTDSADQLGGAGQRKAAAAVQRRVPGHDLRPEGPHAGMT